MLCKRKTDKATIKMKKIFFSGNYYSLKQFMKVWFVKMKKVGQKKLRFVENFHLNGWNFIEFFKIKSITSFKVEFMSPIVQSDDFTFSII